MGDLCCAQFTTEEKSMRDLYDQEYRAGPAAAERNGANSVVTDQVANNDEEMLLQSAQATSFKRCMDRLSRREQLVIRHAFHAGCTYSELAERAGVPCSTMKSEIRRALIRLQHDMDLADSA